MSAQQDYFSCSLNYWNNLIILLIENEHILKTQKDFFIL